MMKLGLFAAAALLIVNPFAHASVMTLDPEATAGGGGGGVILVTPAIIGPKIGTGAPKVEPIKPSSQSGSSTDKQKEDAKKENPPAKTNWSEEAKQKAEEEKKKNAGGNTSKLVRDSPLTEEQAQALLDARMRMVRCRMTTSCIATMDELMAIMALIAMQNDPCTKYGDDCRLMNVGPEEIRGLRRAFGGPRAVLRGISYPPTAPGGPRVGIALTTGATSTVGRPALRAAVPDALQLGRIDACIASSDCALSSARLATGILASAPGGLDGKSAASPLQIKISQDQLNAMRIPFAQ